MRLRSRIACTFWGTTYDPGNPTVRGLRPSDAALDRVARNHPLPLGLLWQSNVLKPALARRGRTLFILTGDARCLTYWLLVPLLRFRGQLVLLWTHGWTRPDPPLRSVVKRLFYSMASGLMLYTHEGRDLGVEAGFNPSRLHVVFNSLQEPPEIISTPESRRDGRQRWLVVSRLVESRQLDMLLHEIHRLSASERQVSLTIVGDGPERPRLQALAQGLGIDTIFVGAMYDEQETAALIQSADIVISPGNVGLAGIHALLNGCPVSTHDDPKRQMPEHIAVVHGVTGVRWPHNDFVAMGEETWSFVASHDRDIVAARCREEVFARWTPSNQAERIVSLITSLGYGP